jgi:exodeoxyribonuclease VII large subunit
MVPSRPDTVNSSTMEKPAGEPVYSVSQLNREARLLLEAGLPSLWISGEISNLARPGSGHLYFSLKDAAAQVRCAFFRQSARGMRFQPENGQQVLARARVSVYEPRGDFQLIVEHLEPAGDGLLLRRFEELKRKLSAEGVFDAKYKQAIPALPRRVGLITSRSGAALRDMLHVLRRRFPAVGVVIYPVQVQGEQARHDIVAALGIAATRGECDLLIVGRGGGSLEDLWAFNEEIVVRAIHACPIPVISAVGHETDFTLSDLVADLRAPTPSGAAELAVPDWRDWLARLEGLAADCSRAAGQTLERKATSWLATDRRLQRLHPRFVLAGHHQRLDELGARLYHAVRRCVHLRQLQAQHATLRLRAGSPRHPLERAHARLGTQRLRLAAAARGLADRPAQRLALAAATLQAFSPLRTLERGYAIVTATSGDILRTVDEVGQGQTVTTQLARGEFDAVVTSVRRPT